MPNTFHRVLPNQNAFPGSLAGLTKREYFAALAMQGILASDVSGCGTTTATAITAVECADALIEALNAEGGK